jgi:hypothetical protein
MELAEPIAVPSDDEYKSITNTTERVSLHFFNVTQAWKQLWILN